MADETSQTTLQKRRTMTETVGQKERWSQGVPDDILQSIAQRLYIPDYQVFRQVCPFWGAAVDRGIATRSCPPALQVLPCLLVHDCYGLCSRQSNCDTVDAFYIEHQYTLVRSSMSFRTEIISDPYTRYCVGSVESWLIVAVCQRFGHESRGKVANFFINPLSHVRVKLPSDNLTLKKTVASSPPPPTTRMQQHHCFVASLGKHNGRGQLGICRPTDRSWTLIDEIVDGINYKDIEMIDQKLYVSGLSNNEYYVLEYDIFSVDDNVTRAEYTCGFCIGIPEYAAADGPERQHARLVKDSASNELFIIIHASKITKGVQVYKMEGKNSNGIPSCKEVTDLGDRMLFLSEKSNKVINDKRVQKNCIYFAYNTFFNDGFWVYSLTDMSFKRINLPKDYSPPMTWTSIWFTPHPW